MEKLEDYIFVDAYEKDVEFKREKLDWQSTRNMRISYGRFRDTEEAKKYKKISLERILP